MEDAIGEVKKNSKESERHPLFFIKMAKKSQLETAVQTNMVAAPHKVNERFVLSTPKTLVST